MAGEWTGTWVASEEGLPNDSDFLASPTTFALVSDKSLVNFSHVGSASFVSGSYKLDQGDGLNSYSDISHEFHLRSTNDDEGSDGIVGACGNTEFGRFISIGVLEPRGSTAQLILARRYIADNDPRAKLTAAEVAALAGLHSGAPWVEGLPWKVAAGWKPGAITSGAVGEGSTTATVPHRPSDTFVAVPSFVKSSFNTKVEYEAWLAKFELKVGDRLPPSISVGVLSSCQ